MKRFLFPSNVLEEWKSKLNETQNEIIFSVDITEDFFSFVQEGDYAEVLLNLQTDKRLIRLEKDKDLNINFIVHSPGIGTRLSSVNANEFLGVSQLHFILSWNPTEITIKIGPSSRVSDMKVGQSRDADFVLRPLGDKFSVKFGGPGVRFTGEVARINGEILIRSTAIRSWQSTLDAIQILQSGSSSQGYTYEVIVSNVIISILCTGFEVYSKRRFIELMLEGVEPDYKKLEKRIFSSKQRDKKLMETMREEAKDIELSLLEYLVNKRRIDFGNWEECKQAYNRTYGIRFGVDLKVKNEVLQNIQKYIDHRHKVVHITPFESRISGFGELPIGESVPHIIDDVIKDFDIFIKSLDKYTLHIILKTNAYIFWE